MINLENLLNEALPALIPEYPVNIAGHSLKLRFDVNVNKTKKGIKLQFVLDQVPTDPRELQNLANEIGADLQEKFGAANLQVIYDVENPYKNVVGFLLPLPSLANFLIANVLKGDTTPGEQSNGVEQPTGQALPATEQPPTEEDDTVREVMMRRAGI